MRPTAPRLQRMLIELEGALRAAGVRHVVSWQGMNLPVMDPAGLVLMKCLALAADPARVHDADDVRYLLQSGTLDASALQQELAVLGEDVLAAFLAVSAPRVRDVHDPREVRL